MKRFIRASTLMVILVLLAAPPGCTSPADKLVGGAWVSQTERTLEFTDDGKVEIQGMIAGYEFDGSTILINGQPGYESVTWVTDDEFVAQEVLQSKPGREQRFTRKR
jgi:hypothetical protein